MKPASIILSILIIGGALGIASLLIFSKSEPPRSEAINPTPIVDVIEVSAGPIHSKIEAYGTVSPHREARIQAQVTGIAIELDERLVIGGRFSEDEKLLQIQPIDFQLAVDQRKSELAQAEVEYALEQGRQIVAQREWELIGDEQPLNELSKRLALRQPQLEQAQIRLKAAESALRRAELDLERATIKAPFNAVVVSESAEKGQLVTTGGTICQLVCTDSFYILATVPQHLARDIQTLEDHGTGAVARIFAKDTESREGSVIRILPDLEEKSRLARLVIAVQDPLSLRDENAGLSKLLIGSYIRLEIEAPVLEKAIRIPRSYVRTDDTVWVMKDGKLEIRPLKIRYRETEDLVVTGGIEAGEKLIVSILPVVTRGMAVRTEDAK